MSHLTFRLCGYLGTASWNEALRAFDGFSLPADKSEFGESWQAAGVVNQHGELDSSWRDALGVASQPEVTAGIVGRDGEIFFVTEVAVSRRGVVTATTRAAGRGDRPEVMEPVCEVASSGRKGAWELLRRAIPKHPRLRAPASKPGRLPEQVDIRSTVEWDEEPSGHRRWINDVFANTPELQEVALAQQRVGFSCGQRDISWIVGENTLYRAEGEHLYRVSDGDLANVMLKILLTDGV